MAVEPPLWRSKIHDALFHTDVAAPFQIRSGRIIVVLTHVLEAPANAKSSLRSEVSGQIECNGSVTGCHSEGILFVHEDCLECQKDSS